VMVVMRMPAAALAPTSASAFTVKIGGGSERSGSDEAKSKLADHGRVSKGCGVQAGFVSHARFVASLSRRVQVCAAVFFSPSLEPKAPSLRWRGIDRSKHGLFENPAA
jgi:hypothetical protein